MKTLSLFRVFALAAIVAGSSSLANADLIVRLQNGFIKPGEDLTMDVLISGDPGNENLHAYNLEIVAAAGSAVAGTTLEFVDPQSEAFLQDPDYVFFGSSDVVDLGIKATTVSTVVTSNDAIAGDDGSFDSSGVEMDVVITSDNLLMRYELEHVLNGAAAGLTIGDTFELAVDPISEFTDSLGNEIDFTVEYDNMQTFATITVVPEPNMVALGVLAAGIMALVGLRRRKQKLALATVSC